MNGRRSGFTLMEMIVVVAILAGLAGLVITKTDWIRREANMAAGASTSGDIVQNIQSYLAATERLPNGLDSLLDTTGALYSGPEGVGSGGGIIGQLDGVGSIPSSTTPTALTYSSSDKRLNSLFRVGLSFVNAHSTTSTNATDSGTVLQSLGTYTTGTASFNPTTLLLVTTGTSLWNTVYPQNVWGSTYSSTTEMEVDQSGTLVSLVALGVGPGNSMNGVTMVSPPQYPGPNSNIYYYRYVAIFAIYTDGRRAQLKTVVDPYGRTIDSSLSQFSTSGPDDLPPGSRTPE